MRICECRHDTYFALRYNNKSYRHWTTFQPMLHCVDCVSEPGVIHRVPADTAPLSDPISVTRVLCGAMILPTIATIVGKIMFGKVESNFQRTLMVCSYVLSPDPVVRLSSIMVTASNFQLSAYWFDSQLCCDV